MAYTTINKSTDYFNTKLYTGNNSNNHSITGVGFAPDLVWQKIRNGTNYYTMFDNVRGATKLMYSNVNDAEITSASGQDSISLDSDGFTVGVPTQAGGINNGNCVAWNWKANGTGSANTDGSISSTVSANTTSGFSIVSYTGNETVSTIGHGLGVTPSMIIVKGRIAARDWVVGQHTQGWTKSAYLNETNAFSSQTHWNNTAPTSSVFTIEGGSNSNVNTNNAGYIAYCFAEKQGFSKFGSYTGNGSTNGTFVYTGFKPAFFMIKNASAAANWTIFDNKRSSSGGSNEIDYSLDANVSNAEETGTSVNDVDFLSNGIKIREDNGDLNGSGQTIIYMAFAEAPLVGSNGVTAKSKIMAKKFKSHVEHERIAKGSSTGRRPNTSTMNKHKRRQTGVKIYKGQGR